MSNRLQSARAGNKITQEELKERKEKRTRGTGNRLPISESLRSALAHHDLAGVRMLLSVPAGQAAFEALEFAYLVNALPLVADKEFGDFVANVLARHAVLRTSVIDKALEAGRRDLAERLVATLGDNPENAYRVALYYLRHGIGGKTLKSMAAAHPRYVGRLIETFPPEQRERLRRELGTGNYGEF